MRFHLTIRDVVWLSLALHLMAIASDPNMIFDEGWYVIAAKVTMAGQPYNVEHTPLMKLIGGLVIKALGDWWLPWRLPTVIMSVLAIYVFYKLAQNFMDDKYALVASIFLSFDTIFFIHGSLFLLDVPAILFGFIGLVFYFKNRYYLMSVALGISFLMKETGLFFVLIVLFTHLVLRHKDYHFKFKSIGSADKTLAICVLLFVGISMGGLWIYDVTYKPEGVSNPIEHLALQYRAFTELLPLLRTPASEVRQPWTWILPFGGNPFNANQYATYTMPATFLSDSRLIANWVSQISLPIAYSCVPVLLFCVYWTLKKKSGAFEKLYIVWVLTTFLPWNVRALITPMRWNYYFIYTIPVICLGIGYVYSKLPTQTKLGSKNFFLAMHILATIIFFFMFFPIVL